MSSLALNISGWVSPVDSYKWIDTRVVSPAGALSLKLSSRYWDRARAGLGTRPQYVEVKGCCVDEIISSQQHHLLLLLPSSVLFINVDSIICVGGYGERESAAIIIIITIHDTFNPWDVNCCLLRIKWP